MIALCKSIFEEKYNEIVIEKREHWTPINGNQDMEVVNHIYRVIVQNHDTSNFVKEYHNLVDVQNEDGGWGNYSQDKKSQIRCTAFAVQMLLRANNDLDNREARFDEAIYKGLFWLVSNQKDDGTWFDDEWGLYDAVSVNVGTLMFTRILPNVPQHIKQLSNGAWEKGMEFVNRSQGEDGAWEYKEKYDTPVCVTAHLLQKTVGYGEKGKMTSLKAMEYLRKVQHEEGHYDYKNIDHTCDTARALMLASELLNDYSSHNTIEKAIKWLLSNRNDDNGWGDFAGDESNMLCIFDGLDTLLKYTRYNTIYNEKMIQTS